MKLLISSILLTFSLFAVGQSFQASTLPIGYSQIEGRVVDYITEKPLANAELRFHKRIIDTLSDGAKSMRPMKEAIDLNIMVKSDSNGRYVAVLPVDADPTYFMIAANADGYEGKVRMFLSVKPNQASQSNFRLIKLKLTQEEEIELERKGLEEKAKRQLEMENSEK